MFRLPLRVSRRRRRTSSLDLVIGKYAHREGEQLVRLVSPGSSRDGELIRQLYDPACGAWRNAPIPRPQ
jgi:hypothetical protein